MALCCDVRLGAPNAAFGYPVLKNNLLPGREDTARLAALIGPGRASILLLGGLRIAADEALSWGLLDRMTTADDLLSTGTALTEIAQSADLNHQIAIKSLIRGDIS